MNCLDFLNKGSGTDRIVTHARQLRSRIPSLLSGLVFDDSGGRLTPSHTNKHGARYRYYVSKSRLRGRPRNDVQDKRWRIPGTELEQMVLRAVRSLLLDHNEMSVVLSLGLLPPNDIDATLQASRELSGELESEDPGTLRERLYPLLSRVQIAEASIAITVALGPLRKALGLDTLEDTGPGTHTIIVPVRITKRGVEQKLVVGGGIKDGEHRDAALIKAIARAHAWFDDLKSGEARDLTELANRDGLPPAYVRSHLPLAFLAPTIVAAILEGRQPPDVTAKRLMYQMDLPIDWAKQQRLVGFNQSRLHYWLGNQDSNLD